MGGHLLLAHRAVLQPPLSRHRHDTHQHLGVQRGRARVEVVGRELRGEDPGDLDGDVGQQRRVCTGRAVRAGREDAETVGGVLDIGQQGQGGPLGDPRGRAGGVGSSLCVPVGLRRRRGVRGRVRDRRGDRGRDRGDLPVDDDGVQALLAAEVLVDHRFGHLGAGRHLLHARGVEAALGEQSAGHGDELFAPLAGAHAGALGRHGPRPRCCGRPAGRSDGAGTTGRSAPRPGPLCGGPAGGWGPRCSAGTSRSAAPRPPAPG